MSSETHPHLHHKPLQAQFSPKPYKPRDDPTPSQPDPSQDPNSNVHPNPDPTPNPETLPKPQMTFQGKVSGARALVGTDSFTSGIGFIHPSFVENNRLTTRPCNAQISLGDGQTQHNTTHECQVHLQLEPYHCKDWLVVFPIPEPYDGYPIRGRMQQHEADLLYSIHIQSNKRKFTIKTILGPVRLATQEWDSHLSHTPDPRT